MEVKIIGEGNQLWPVLTKNRWGVYTLGTPSGGTRTVGVDRLLAADDTPLQPQTNPGQNAGNQP